MTQTKYTLRIKTQGFSEAELEQLEHLVEAVCGAGTVQPRTGQPTPIGTLFAAAPDITITVFLPEMPLANPEAKATNDALIAPYRKLAEEVAAKTHKWVDSRFAGGRREVELEVELLGAEHKIIKLRPLKR